MPNAVARMMARRRATVAATEKGLSRFEARRRLDKVPDAEVDTVIETECRAAGVSTAVPRAIGDGAIIDRIKQVCKENPELVSAIMKALLALIGL